MALDELRPLLVRVAADNLRGPVAHENHVQNGENVDVAQNLDTEQLVVLNVLDLAVQRLRVLDALLCIVNHDFHGRHEEAGRTHAGIPHERVHVRPRDSRHQRGHEARRQHHVIELVVLDGNPVVQTVQNLAREIQVNVAFEKRQNVLLDLLVNGLDDAFTVHGLPEVALLEHGLQIVQYHANLVG